MSTYRIIPGHIPTCDRQTTNVHTRPCKHCPSIIGTDPESQDILTSGSAEWLRESLFTCGWRPDRLCRGWYDKVLAALTGIGEDISPAPRGKANYTRARQEEA